jgi:hypothetical protein
MKTNATLIVILLLAATSVFAQDAATDNQRVDFSKGKLLRLFANEEFDDAPIDDVRFHAGAVQFRAMGTSWRFNYLPIMAPLPGTRFTTNREWPDAFSLTNTPIATSPRAMRRMMRAERRRIERVTNPKATIKVTTD